MYRIPLNLKNILSSHSIFSKHQFANFLSYKWHILMQTKRSKISRYCLGLKNELFIYTLYFKFLFLGKVHSQYYDQNLFCKVKNCLKLNNYPVRGSHPVKTIKDTDYWKVEYFWKRVVDITSSHTQLGAMPSQPCSPNFIISTRWTIRVTTLTKQLKLSLDTEDWHAWITGTKALLEILYP